MPHISSVKPQVHSRRAARRALHESLDSYTSSSERTHHEARSFKIMAKVTERRLAIRKALHNQEEV